MWLFYATVIDYLAVRGMSRSRVKTPWLLVSLVNDLGMLAFFKYGGAVNALLARHGIHHALPAPGAWITDITNYALAHLGIPYHYSLPGLVLPVGMSFYIFQSLTYSIGFYRGEVARPASFFRYASFVAMFPQLLSGPIERAKNLLPQLEKVPRITGQDVADGLSLFVVGLFKKVVIADWLGLYVDKIYASPGQFQAPALLAATLAFSWQIYFDFSGYTDMARGVARTLGFPLMLNFNNPYMATGLGDFWRRWHISLSTWFRDYVYIPLGGNRRGRLAMYRNMFLTMVISGIWHGATWNFALWGALHGLGRVLTRGWE
jgi:D-alanyl-lipoteichoic acid acyltransferase DltB (MBOAT superfamily)